MPSYCNHVPSYLWYQCQRQKASTEISIYELSVYISILVSVSILLICWKNFRTVEYIFILCWFCFSDIPIKKYKIREDNLYLKSGQIQQKRYLEQLCPTINTCMHNSNSHIKIHTRTHTHTHKALNKIKYIMYTVKMPVEILQIWCMVFISPKLSYNSWKQ